MNNSKKKTIFTLSLFTVFMFSFSYMLVPLYDIFCEVTGLNGKTNQQKVEINYEKPIDRYVKIQFTSNVANSGPFIFEPSETEMIVQVGKIYTTHYVVTNKTSSIKQATASPSVVPSEDAEYFKKIECFCFNQQKLEAKETKELPLQFVIDNKLSKETNQLILSYTMFNTTEQLNSKLED